MKKVVFIVAAVFIMVGMLISHNAYAQYSMVGALISHNVYAQSHNERLFKAYLSLSDAYDSNVLKSRERSANKGDNIIYVRPSLSLLLPFRFRGDLNISYNFTYLNYSRFSAYNTYYSNLNASFNLYPVKNLAFGILDSYKMVPISPQLPTFAVTNIRQANYLNPYIAYKFVIMPRLDMEVRYDFVKVSFPGSGPIGIPYSVNEPQINAVIELNRYVKLKPGFKYVSQTFASSLGTINQAAPYLGIDIANGSRLSFTGNYSYATFSFTNTTRSGSIYLAKLIYKVSNRFKADVYINGSKAFDIFGRLYTQFVSGSDLSYNLTKQLVMNIGLKYLKLKYAGENYYTDASGGDIGLNYKFTKWTELFGKFYYYNDKPESSKVNKYQDSRILFGIRAGLL